MFPYPLDLRVPTDMDSSNLGWWIEASERTKNASMFPELVDTLWTLLVFNIAMEKDGPFIDVFPINLPQTSPVKVLPWRFLVCPWARTILFFWTRPFIWPSNDTCWKKDLTQQQSEPRIYVNGHSRILNWRLCLRMGYTHIYPLFMALEIGTMMMKQWLEWGFPIIFRQTQLNISQLGTVLSFCTPETTL